MAGLLDQFFGNADQTQALGLLGTYLMAGQAPQGFQAAMQHMASAKEREMRGLLAQAQLDEARAQGDERKAKAASMQAEMQRQQGIQRGLPGLMGGGYTGGEPVPQTMGGIPMFSQPMGAAPVQPRPQGFDVSRALTELRMKPEEATAYFNAMQLGRPEVARVEEVDDGRGGKARRQLDKYGNPVGSDMAGYIAPVQVGQGDRTSFVRPMPGVTLPMFQSPDSKASNATTMRGQNMTDARAREANGVKPQFHGGQWVYPPNAQQPNGSAVPVAGYTQPLGEGPKKQIAGIDALGGAIDEYVSQLDKWGTTDILRPDRRAEMGTKYNNMMLQAKEAYNLGVLNGPDYTILTSVVTDPSTGKGAITSNEAMRKQATELKRIMGGVRSAVSGQGSAAAAPAGAQRITGDADYNRLPSGAQFIGPDGQLRRKP